MWCDGRKNKICLKLASEVSILTKSDLLKTNSIVFCQFKESLLIYQAKSQKSFITAYKNDWICWYRLERFCWRIYSWVTPSTDLSVFTDFENSKICKIQILEKNIPSLCILKNEQESLLLLIFQDFTDFDFFKVTPMRLYVYATF